MSSPGFSTFSTWGVDPGSVWNSAIGYCRVWPSEPTVSTVASNARIATAMSLGCVAIQASLPPTIARFRLKPPIAAQPLPGLRLLQGWFRSEEHTSELQSLMRISYAVFCLKKKNQLNIDL